MSCAGVTSIGSNVTPITMSLPFGPSPSISSDIALEFGAVARIACAPPSFCNSSATNAAEELQKLGGAQAILATAPNSKAMSELIDGLGPNGKLMVIGVTFDPIEVTPAQLISGSRTIQGWA